MTVVGSYRESETCKRAGRYVHAAMDAAEERCGVLEDPKLMPASLKIEIDALRTAALTLERRMERSPSPARPASPDAAARGRDSSAVANGPLDPQGERG